MNENSAANGFNINNAPAAPITNALILHTPIFSPSKGPARSDTNNGYVYNPAAICAKERNGAPEKKKNMHITCIIARRYTGRQFSGTTKVNPPANFARQIIRLKLPNARIVCICQNDVCGAIYFIRESCRASTITPRIKRLIALIGRSPEGASKIENRL